MNKEEILDKIDAWHFDGAGEGLALHEYLGWTWNQYRDWAITGELPDED